RDVNFSDDFIDRGSEDQVALTKASKLRANRLHVVGEDIHGGITNDYADHVGLKVGKAVVERGRWLKDAAKSQHATDGYHCESAYGNERSPTGSVGEMGFAFRENLFFEPLGDRDALEGGTGGVLKGAVLLEPGVEFGIDFGEPEGFGEVGIVAVDGWAVEKQNLFGVLAIHGAPSGYCPACRTQAFFEVERC